MALKLTPPLKAFAASTLAMLISGAVCAADGNPRVNQLGYIPNAAKIATLATGSSSPVGWELRQGNTVIASGESIPQGFDSASGENVHHIDFSHIDTDGSNYSIAVGGDQSYEFDISPSVFSAVAYDSIKYFYHNRSGIEIRTEFTGGGNGSFGNDSRWARPAGHLNEGANQGDFNVPCFTGTCNYSLDVTRGWYDAGDHGKYVVNGGISFFKLASMYERAVHLGNNAAALGDNTLNIPESGNGVADILDEIRWQMEFMLGMQVPQGQNLSGMAHHKVQDDGWTGLPLAPHEDGTRRHLIPPTTAATLNLAATAAMSARLFDGIDNDFANACLQAAQSAWDAAKAHPSIFHPDSNTHPYQSGGGAYGDTDVSDEFLWAAAELYITTGDSKYAGDVNLNGLGDTNYSWQGTEIPALMSLATVPTSHTASMRDTARGRLVDIANQRLSTSNSEGYFAPINSSEYEWGSNNLIANTLTVLGLAYDITGNDEYAQAVGNGLNYIFGQNALSRSYVTGHGENAISQPHHRFWAGVLNGSYPWAPPGSFSGGPNTGLEDDLSRGQLDGCQSSPQTCYIDQIGAWSTNEITINWNSALAWSLAFYDDYALNSGSSDPTISITSPSGGDQFDTDQTVVVTASASDADGSVSSVDFFVNGQFEGTDSTAPYAFSYSSTNDGVYTLSAEATDNDGNVGESSSVTITIGTIVNIPPEAQFSHATNGRTVSLDASASNDPDGDIVNYSWDFGDGQVGSGITASHTYLNDGDFQVILDVTDNLDDSGSTSSSVNVFEPVNLLNCSVGGVDIWNNGAVIQDVTVTNAGAATMNGWSVDIDAGVNVGTGDSWGGASVSGSGNNIVTASSNNTLQPGESQTFGFIISHSGNFNSASCASASQENQAPVASFTTSRLAFDSSFDASGSSDADGDTLSYTWDFGDNTTGSGVNASHTYTAAGFYTVELTVSDGELSNTTTREVVADAGCRSDCGGINVKVEAEAFNSMNGIQTEATQDTGGGLNIGWVDANDWLIYDTINIPETGTYAIEYRVASKNGGGRIQFEEGGGGQTYGAIDVPNTGDWQNWETIEHIVTLPAGDHQFAIAALSGGFNVNWFRIRTVK
ncbi:MAG: endoglucanase [Flavobacteriales bacterium]|jgi:endoglucanase